MDREAVTDGAEVARTPYELLGDAGIRALADAFYEAMDRLPEAAGIRAMHAGDLGDVKRRLAAYLTGWMGGPPVYLALAGTVCLTGPHARFHIGPEERDQWLRCMDEALARIGASEALKAMLAKPLFHLADTVRNRDASAPGAGAASRDPNIIAVG